MQNRFLKKIMALSLMSVMLFSANSELIISAQASSPVIAVVETTSNTESESNGATLLRSDYTGWRYMVEDGLLYRRLFNYSKDEWIGEWILCE